jgi:8-hydroxy-5-deazaflavin:NADPH oxidoreductase
MRVGIIGGGRIAAALGGRWESAGHDVVYGLRDPSKKEGAVSIGQALQAADVVLIAIPGDAVTSCVREHASAFDGKVVTDATNNFRGPAMNSWADIASALPNASLYRAFNSYGWDVFASPEVGGEQPDLFYAGSEGAGQEAIEELITDAGMRPVRVGGQDQAGVVDGVLRLWFTLSQTRGRRIAFRLLAD